MARLPGGGQDGASVVDYALLLALIMVVAVVGIRAVGDTNSRSLSNTASRIENR